MQLQRGAHHFAVLYQKHPMHSVQVGPSFSKMQIVHLAGPLWMVMQQRAPHQRTVTISQLANSVWSNCTLDGWDCSVLSFCFPVHCHLLMVMIFPLFFPIMVCQLGNYQNNGAQLMNRQLMKCYNQLLIGHVEKGVQIAQRSKCTSDAISQTLSGTMPPMPSTATGRDSNTKVALAISMVLPLSLKSTHVRYLLRLYFTFYIKDLNRWGLAIPDPGSDFVWIELDPDPWIESQSDCMGYIGL